jgi:hypothetical protein
VSRTTKDRTAAGVIDGAPLAAASGGDDAVADWVLAEPLDDGLGDGGVARPALLPDDPPEQAASAPAPMSRTVTPASRRRC